VIIYPVKLKFDYFLSFINKKLFFKFKPDSINCISSFLTLLFFFLISIFMLYMIFSQLTYELMDLSTTINKTEIQNYFRNFLNIIEQKFSTHLSINEFISKYDIETKISVIVSSFAKNISKLGLTVIIKTGDFFIDYFFMLLILYYFLSDGVNIVERIKKLSPMNYEDKIFLIKEFKECSKSAIVGTLLSAVFQGFLTAIPFIFFNWHYFVWALIMSILCLLPIAGASIIWLPASIILFVQNKIYSMIFFIIWCVSISLLENIIREKIMNKLSSGIKPHPLIFLFGLIGGVYLFGITGLIFGPVITALFLSFIYIYEKRVIGS
ncbi:AI-2E family transporter, partial [Candidatus Dependentiae bacterium]|nr:AI-2E family transporter [Candidatus Dependentiae bacterium]